MRQSSNQFERNSISVLVLLSYGDCPTNYEHYNFVALSSPANYID
jgi:hypothetical protein